jgi:hypothetical protein
MCAKPVRAQEDVNGAMDPPFPWLFRNCIGNQMACGIGHSRTPGEMSAIDSDAAV